MLSCLQTKCIFIKIQGVFVRNSTMSLEADVPYYLNVGTQWRRAWWQSMQPCSTLARHGYLVFKSTHHCLNLYFVVDEVCWSSWHGSNYRCSLFLILGQCSDFSLQLVRTAKPYKVEPLISIVVFLQGWVCIIYLFKAISKAEISVKLLLGRTVILSVVTVNTWLLFCLKDCNRRNSW